MMRRKGLICLLCIFVLFLFCGCHLTDSGKKSNKNDKTGKTDITLGDQEYSLSILKTVQVNDDLSIKLYNVDDSRCPENVECYWEGELKYQITINDDSHSISTVLNKEIEYQDYIISIVPEKCDINLLVLKVGKK